MTQKSKQESIGVTNELNQHAATDDLHTTYEVENRNDRIKAETTPETCRASLDGN